MNFFGKIVISVLAATAAWALLTFVTVAQPALVFLVLVIATLATAFLVTIPVSKAAVTASKPSNGSSKKQTTKASVTEGPREEGEVKWFNVSKGFGFITKDDGEEIFVHFRSIIGEGRRGLKDGQRVSFVEANTDKGPQAENVEPL
ncbi:'Cold-shock' DNA-binding domain protein [marine gamma proteobacterium HTCC2148]|nr:'Cold-shock' DNA-binding domain protein [marine gamma proteobacterium HTCC2148]